MDPRELVDGGLRMAVVLGAFGKSVKIGLAPPAAITSRRLIRSVAEQAVGSGAGRILCLRLRLAESRVIMQFFSIPPK